MNIELSQVKDFLRAFEFPILQGPGLAVTQKSKDLMIKLLKEEVGELQVALEKDDLIGAYDALADVQYVTLGTVVMLGGTDIFTMVFDRVHESNMSKLGEDGKPIHAEDGKVIKSDQYQPPNLQPIFDWFREREAIRASNNSPNKIIYGNDDCGDPCKIELTQAMIIRIKKFQNAIKSFRDLGLAPNEKEHVSVNITDLEWTVWSDDGAHESKHGAFVNINRYGASIQSYGYDGEHVVHIFDVDAMKDVEVDDDILGSMTIRAEWQNPSLGAFLAAIPQDHRRYIEAQAEAYRSKNQNEAGEV